MLTLRRKYLIGCVLTLLAFPSFGATQETPEEIDVTFELHAPELTNDTRVFITGSLPSLGNWNPGKVLMQSAGEHKWTYQVKSQPGYPIEYKYTLGSWAREGANPDGRPLKNFAIQPKSDTTIADQIRFWTSGKKTKVDGQVTGNVKYHRQLVYDGLLPRDVVVWLPPGYEKSEQRYSVLYMHDGQNIVDPATSAFGVDWQIDETVTRLIEEKTIVPIIVVGIYNTAQRSKDYLPGPQGSKYEAFICENLKPLIDKTYRTDPSRKSTAIAGSSAGGICAFTMAWNRPEVFSKAICMSPAFQYRRTDGSLTVDYLKDFAALERPSDPPFFYIDNGGVGLEQILQPGIDQMLIELRNKGMEPGKNFTWKRFPDARHDESAWAERMPAALALIFGLN